MLNTLISEQTFQKLSQDQANQFCFECGASNPIWISLPNAIFLCHACAGLHRQFGVHISFVRSITMDSWNDKQLKMMLVGGNQMLKDYFASIAIDKQNFKEIGQKYRTKGAVYYREQIKAKVEELPLPEAPTMEQAILEDQTLAKSIPILNDSQKPSQINSQQLNGPLQQDEQEDTLKKVKLFFTSGIQKTSEIAMVTAQKIEENYHDEEFQNKIKAFKETASKKTQEISEETKVIAIKSIDTMKKSINSAWGFLRKKINQIQNKDSTQQQQFSHMQVEELQVDKQVPLIEESQLNFHSNLNMQTICRFKNRG